MEIVKLAQEEWDALTPEEQEARVDEKPEITPPPPEVKEDVVIIDGKPRPLKNFVSEITRKVKEDLKAEKPPDPPPAASSSDMLKRIKESAEKEMLEDGSSFPIRTVTQLIERGTSYHLKQSRDDSRNAAKVIRATKKELRSTYKDYGKYEDEFEDALDGVAPSQVSSEGLKMVFNAIRGSKITDTPPPPKKDERIVGPHGGSAGGGGGGKSILSTIQKREAEDMGFDSEENYSARLKKRQFRAKAEGWKIIPQTLGETAQK